MNSKLLAFIVIVLVLSLIVLNLELFGQFQSGTPDFFVGIDVAYADVDAIKAMIDEVNPYTNIFVIGSTGISYNEKKLDEICQYLHNRDMNFLIYTEIPHTLPMIQNVVDKFGDSFLGIYFWDEQGGKQLDIYDYRWVDAGDAKNYTEAANQFVNHLHYYLFNKEFRNETLPYSAADFPLFTSDYALYWFDYKVGYDVVLAEFGWNYSRQLNVALNRGAATIQNRDWGVIVAWTYNNPPYIESGEALYDDLVYAYDNGAKYVLVFDSNENYTESILTEEHFEALERFWQYTSDNPRNDVVDRVAFVLPKDFGYGFRGPEDKIWGLWEADETSLEMSHHLGEFLVQYGTRLDVIYDDSLIVDQIYSKYIFWNGTIISSS
jgi:hypothetical protein